jgi:hypothetical protein
MSLTRPVTLFSEARPAVLTVSHERSGTHFLMNSLANCYGYESVFWIDFDIPTVNFLRRFSREQIRDSLLALTARPIANIVKSHHAAEFFTDQLQSLLERYVIFVIYRDPVAVMLSFWRHLHCFRPWVNAGPQVADPLTFARAAPSGQMLRYQAQSCANILERWAAHVRGWHAAAQRFPRIRLVRYEDLDEHYEATIESFAPSLGRLPKLLIRPSRDFNVVPGGPADPMKTGIPPDVDGLRQLCRETVGDTLALLGYS